MSKCSINNNKLKIVKTTFNKIKQELSKTEEEELYTKIYDKLTSTFPHIKLNKIEEKERVIGEAVGTLINYVENASLDTLPIAYTYVYINILQHTTFVKNIINKYKKLYHLDDDKAKEKIVTEVSDIYIKLVKNNGFNDINKINFFIKLWDKIKEYIYKAIGKEYISKIKLYTEVNILANKMYNGTNKEAITLKPKKGFKVIDP